MPAEAASAPRNLPARFDPVAALRLALPREHGSWSLALEPLALGLLVAPSRAGIPLALAGIAGFFLRRPTKLLLQSEPDPRRSLARLAWGILLSVTVAALMITAYLGGVEQLWPLIPAALAGLVFVWFDSRGENREGVAELAGVTAFALLPATFASLAGWHTENCLALAAVMLTRSAPTVLVVRTALRRRKGHNVSNVAARLSASMAAGILSWLAIMSLVPWAVAAFSGVLAARAFWLGSSQAVGLSAKQLGLIELFWGVAAIVVAAVAW